MIRRRTQGSLEPPWVSYEDMDAEKMRESSVRPCQELGGASA